MSYLSAHSDTANVRAKQEVASKALRFVYPGLQFSVDKIRPGTAAIALYLARALDGTSRATYGAFKFYESVAIGALKGNLVWSDVPQAAFDAANDALEDEEPQRNAIAAAWVRSAAPQRLVQRHLRDPETFPMPELRITPGTPLHSIIFERKGIFETLLGR